MAKYRKKPVVVEAEEFRLGDTPYPEGVVSVWVRRDDPGAVVCRGTEEPDVEANMAFGIKTLEGWHVVIHGDWIITGVKGERYPCKPDVFDATYDPVEGEAG